MITKRFIRISVLCGLIFAAAGGSAHAQQARLAERVAALKASLAASQAALRHYQWTETTNIMLMGEVKSSVKKRCYYGPDGVLQKVDISAPPQAESPRGLRGRVVAYKKEELTTYMKSAVALIKSYVPPDPAKIQAVKDAGGVKVKMSETDAKLVFRNYLKPGDSLDVSVNIETNLMTGLGVASYLDDPDDEVTLGVVMSALPDGTTYASKSTLDAPAKDLTVVVQNSGHQKLTD